MKILGLLLHAATAALLCVIALAAAAADYPAPNEGDWNARDFRFHTGDVMPETAPALHDGRRALRDSPY